MPNNYCHRVENIFQKWNCLCEFWQLPTDSFLLSWGYLTVRIFSVAQASCNRSLNLSILLGLSGCSESPTALLHNNMWLATDFVKLDSASTLIYVHLLRHKWNNSNYVKAWLGVIENSCNTWLLRFYFKLKHRPTLFYFTVSWQRGKWEYRRKPGNLLRWSEQSVCETAVCA